MYQMNQILLIFPLKLLLEYLEEIIFSKHLNKNLADMEKIEGEKILKAHSTLVEIKKT